MKKKFSHVLVWVLCFAMVIGFLPSQTTFAEETTAGNSVMFEDDCSSLSEAGWLRSAQPKDGNYITDYPDSLGNENNIVMKDVLEGQYLFYSSSANVYSALTKYLTIGEGTWYAEFDMRIADIMTPSAYPVWRGFTFDFNAGGKRYKIAFNGLDENGNINVHVAKNTDYSVVESKTVALPQDDNMHTWRIAYLGSGKLSVYLDGTEVSAFTDVNADTDKEDGVLIVNSTYSLESGTNEIYMDNFILAKEAVEEVSKVYYVASNGSDENEGTIEAPFKTINYALKQLQPGDTLLIRGGVYNEYLVLVGKGNNTDPRPITIKNYEGEEVTLINSVNPSLQYIVYVGNCKNLTFSGITFTNEGALDESGQQLNNYLTFVDNSSNIKFENCTYSEAGGGLIFRAGTKDCEVSSCVFHDLDYPYGGILLYQGAQNINVYNNVFYDNFYGIELLGDGGNDTTNNKIYNNTFKGNVNDIGANQVGGTPEGNIIRNNIFSSKLEVIVTSEDNTFLSNNSLDYNVYNSNTFDGAVAAVFTNGEKQDVTFDEFFAMGHEEHGIKGDPCFRDPDNYDFELQEGSVCHNAGTAEYTPETDILGRSRDGANDIGAYKYTGSRLYYVSPGGDNSNDGSFSTPFGSIQHAVDTASSIDIIVIRGGTYNEDVTVNGKDNIIIKNYNDETPAITGSMTVASSSNTTVRGLSLKGQNSLIVNSSQNIKLYGLDVTSGITVANTNQYEISSSYIHGSANQDGAVVINNSRNGKVFNNVIYGNQQGISLEEGETSANQVVNNTFYNNQNADVSISTTAGNNVFKNNIFSSGLAVDSMDVVTGNVFDYNCYNVDYLSDSIGNIAGDYDNGISLEQFKALDVEENGFLGNVEFYDVMSSDFRITTYSDCRSKGQLVSFANKDIIGITRNDPIDVGAFAYDGLTKAYYVSPDGNDANTGSMNYPFKTIQYGIDIMKPGETLTIRGGMYNESFNINDKAGNGSLGYAVKAYEGEDVVIDLSGTDEASAISISSSANWTIENISINNINQYGISLSDSQNITLKSASIAGNGTAGINGTNAADCTMSGIEIVSSDSGTIGKGISLLNSNGCKIDKCKIDSMSEEGIYFEASSESYVKASIITGNSTGITLVDSTGCIIYNNTLYNNSSNDVAFAGTATGNTVKNNIFGSNASSAALKLVSSDSIDNDFDYNLYNKSETDNIVEYESSFWTIADFRDAGKEADGILGEPKFYDAQNGDFYLQKGSPCIGAGIKDANTPAEGFDGAVFGVPVDIGALHCPLSYNVYYVSPDGNDDNDGSFENPWKTVKKGLLSLEPTDTLYLREGEYKERVNLYNKQASEYKGEHLWYTVENYPGEIAILDSDYNEDVAIKFDRCSYWKIKGLKIREYTGTGIWTANNTEYVILEGLEIYNISSPQFGDYGITGILGNVGNYITVKNCHIHDISSQRRSQIDHGIYLGYGAHHWVIDSNTIHDTPGAGIQFNGAPTAGNDSIVTNNLLYNNKYGMVVNRNERTVVSNNTFYNNWYNDIYMDWFVHGVVIQNNIFYNDYELGATVITEDRTNEITKEVEVSPSLFGVYFEEVNGNTIRNNIYKYVNYDAGIRAEFYGDPIPVADYISSQTQNEFIDLTDANPMLVDPQNEDFRLQDLSPCVDAGLVENAPEKDFFGNDRIGKPDMGAIEWGIKINLICETMQAYVDSEDLKGPLVNQLTNALDQAEHQWNKGSKDNAIHHVECFIKHLNNNGMQKFVSESAKEVLITEANVLIEFWSEQ